MEHAFPGRAVGPLRAGPALARLRARLLRSATGERVRKDLHPARIATVGSSLRRDNAAHAAGALHVALALPCDLLRLGAARNARSQRKRRRAVPTAGLAGRTDDAQAADRPACDRGLLAGPAIRTSARRAARRGRGPPARRGGARAARRRRAARARARRRACVGAGPRAAASRLARERRVARAVRKARLIEAPLTEDRVRIAARARRPDTGDDHESSHPPHAVSHRRILAASGCE